MATNSARRATRPTTAAALVLALLAGILTVLVAPAPAGADSTATFTNATKVSIPDSGQANPYPSTITVAGTGTSIQHLQVVIKGVSHGCTKDLDVLLVGPDGTKTTLFADNGAPAIEFDGCTNITKNSVTIDDACADFSNSMPGGADICVRPSDNDALGHQGDSWPTVGDEFPALNLSTFSGKNPAGVWKLYVVDDAGNDSGAFNGGWQLKVVTSNSPPTAQPQSVSAFKGSPTTVTLGGTDPDGDALTCSAPTTTVSGKGTLTGSGCTRTFTPAARASGTDKFSFKVVDDDGSQSLAADVVFTIENRNPEAGAIAITVGRNERVAFALGGTDPDPGEGVALTCNSFIGDTTLGKVSGSGCNVTYAAKNTNGTESFNFLVNDGFGGLSGGSVQVTVVDPVLPGCTSTDSQNARYVCRVYLDLLNRTAEPGGKAYWLRRLDSGESRVLIIRTYQRTNEYRRTVVDDVYKVFLGRKADTAGRAFWAEKIRTGANPDQIRASVIGSGEYYNRAGASPAGFAAALYQQVLRRPATSAETTSVTNQLKAGATRGGIAAKLLATKEGDTATVASIYERFLRRTPPASQTNAWVAQLQRGITELKLVEQIVASSEYYNRA
jgi:subtilisin-like proprotein convertase family protein